MRLWLSIALLSVLLLAAFAYARLPGSRGAGVFPVEPPTPYFRYEPATPRRGRMLVVHGLDANKEIMNVLSYALADSGFEVYSIDLPGHGASTEGFDGLLASRALRNVLDHLGPDTLVLGHSLGAGLLLDLANDRTFPAMVLLSPAPTIVARTRASRVLVMTGEFDMPRIREFVSGLEHAAGQAIELRTTAWAGHTGFAFRPDVIHDIAEWIGGDTSSLYTRSRFALLLCMLIAAAVLGIILLRGRTIPESPIDVLPAILSYIAASGFAFVVLSFWVVLSWLRLFAVDYMLSFVLLAGMALSLRGTRISFAGRPLFHGVLAAAYIIAIAVLAGSELIHLTLSAGRMWRFGVIVLATLPLAIADEKWLRPLRPWWKAAGLAALTRILIGSFVVTGVLTLNRADAFLVLILHLVILFWVALWFAGEFVRRHTQDPLATALFAALVQAWMFAAVFVTV